MIYNFDDQSFIDSDIYKEFMNENSALGFLHIKVSASNDAKPIKGARVIVSTMYKDYTIVLFDGVTDESGMIKKLELPTLEVSSDDEIVPSKRVYDIKVSYEPFKYDKTFSLNIYEGICAVQNINIDIEGDNLWQ